MNLRKELHSNFGASDEAFKKKCDKNNIVFKEEDLNDFDKVCRLFTVAASAAKEERRNNGN